MAAPPTVLDVEGLAVRFGARTVFSNVSFSVARGTALAVIGPNGSGKTVLFRALIGAIPYGGTVRWAPGTRLGYVPQKLDLERDVPVTGLDFLRARVALARASSSEIPSVLNLVGMSTKTAAQPIGVLSGGQFQRLLVAFALVGEPDLLLLDEPTAGVDEPGQEQLHALVGRLQRERRLTVVFISYELSVVYRYASEVLCLGRAASFLGAPHVVLTPERLGEMYGTPMDFHVHDH